MATPFSLADFVKLFRKLPERSLGTLSEDECKDMLSRAYDLWQLNGAKWSEAQDCVEHIIKECSAEIGESTNTSSYDPRDALLIAFFGRAEIARQAQSHRGRRRTYSEMLSQVSEALRLAPGAHLAQIVHVGYRMIADNNIVREKLRELINSAGLTFARHGSSSQIDESVIPFWTNLRRRAHFARLEHLPEHAEWITWFLSILPRSIDQTDLLLDRAALWEFLDSASRINDDFPNHWQSQCKRYLIKRKNLTIDKLF